MQQRTPLKLPKSQRISCGWPVFRQTASDNQRKNKRVESRLVRCLDGGSSPPISTTSIDFQLVTSSVHEFVHENTSFRGVFSICNPIRKPSVIHHHLQKKPGQQTRLPTLYRGATPRLATMFCKDSIFSGNNLAHPRKDSFDVIENRNPFEVHKHRHRKGKNVKGIF